MAQAYRVERWTEADTSGDATEREYDALGAAQIKLAETARKSTMDFGGTYYLYWVASWLDYSPPSTLNRRSTVTSPWKGTG